MRRTILLALSAAILAALFAAPAVQAKGVKVKAMTRNLYLGTDLIPIAVARDQAEVEQRALEGYNQVKANDFPARARALATEVRRFKPDVIGLQEVALWRRGPKDGPGFRSREIEIDYLRIYNRALRRAGQRYRIARVQNEFDLEVGAADGRDVRLTMRDVLLVRRGAGIRVRRSNEGAFRARVTINTPALGPIRVKRGWVYADLSKQGKRFRVVNTHLEAFGNSERTAQARELIARGGPARVRGAAILVGDLNSDYRDRGGNDSSAYDALTRFRFRDTWIRAMGSRPGFTAGRGADLRTAPGQAFDTRIDYVLTRGRIATRDSRVIGIPQVRGRYPSDHAGVVSSLTLK